MDSPISSKRKRYSASAVKTSDIAESKKRSINSSTEQLIPSFTPPKLIDQLYHTYQSLKTERVSSSQIESSQKEQKSQTSKISTAKKAAIKLKQNSLELKSSELKKKKTEYCKSRIAKEKEQKFIVETVNRAWEFVLLIYDDIKYMVQKEGGFDHHFSDVSDMKNVIIEKLKIESEKLEVSSEEGNFETEISDEKCALENLIKTRSKIKEEEEKSQDSDEVLFTVKNVEEKLNSIEGYIKNLNDEEIVLENVSQKKTDQILEENSKFSQAQQKLEEEFNVLETQLKDLGDVDEMKESAYLKIKELILTKINPDTSIEKDFKGEIQQIEVQIKELDLKLDLQKASADSTNQLLKLESSLRDSKNAINFILSKNIDVDNLDKSLIKVNKELELLLSEKISTENKLRSQELEDLIRQQEKNNEGNSEILQELHQDLNCEKEESIIHDLELDLSEKEKVRNEIFENYSNIKKVNNEHLEKNPNLLETNSLTDFASMKKKLEAAVNSAQQREKTLDKRYEIKLKELEHKSKKYLAALKEVHQEFNPMKEKSKVHNFSSLQTKIKEAEEKLQKKKKDLKKRALPVITKSEPVKIDLETLSLIKTLTQKLPEKPEYTLFSDDESIDSDVRFDRLSETYQFQSVQLNKKQETMKKNSEKEEFLFPLTQVKAVSPEADLNKEGDFFPLSQARGLKPFSEDHSENPEEDEYSFPLTQGKNEKSSSQTSFEELRSEYVKSPKNEKRVITSSQKPSSQDSFEYESQAKEKNVARSQPKVEISTPSKGRSVKEAEKERGRSTDRRFFKSSSQTVSKSYKRSKFIPPRKF
ncbi:lamin-like protein [Belonocnema kinseyi]|uniref:lamin-like protein n=1 Tax=Belonocnema kinseyi TaxID=2817044 RepID=UPI00143CE2A7|nr:lamin-like protein [Belonocnema kinseyi]